MGFLLSCLLSVAPVAHSSVRPAPVLLVLNTGNQGNRERRLHDEVSLLLDGFAVLSIPVNVPSFSKWSLSDQLGHALLVAQDNQAVGVLWVAEPAPGQLMVHVLGIGTGRALIRTLEFDALSGAEKGLALIVRELLGTAFLQAEPETIVPELNAVVREVRRNLPRQTPVPEPTELVTVTRLPISLAGSVVTGVSLIGARSHLLSLGGQLRGEYGFSTRLSLGLEGEAHFSSDRADSVNVQLLEIPVGLTGSFAAPVGNAFVVPRLSVLGGVNVVWAQSSEGAISDLVWSMRARAALGLRGAATSHFRLQGELSFDIVPLRSGVRAQATGEELWRAPWLEIHLAAGFLWAE